MLAVPKHVRSVPGPRADHGLWLTNQYIEDEAGLY
jgi:hypothetical protein